ncbi:sensor histidine kinase [Denitromonas iodatirespirans]|uniref:Virulence sensor protein BvgS n=1 Tax=Denitromonas iodatirespirans TaxID=2795389 RepID=A0A944HDD7_DENI1|nr:ATP-binding protein [Denitromonas iodatirespirans]MBT0963622.1 PAS domain-containing protein [Denitromonas iodatirespirans]
MSRADIELMLDASAEMLLVINARTLTVRSANRAAAARLGYSVQALAGTPIVALARGLADMCFWDEVQAGGAGRLTDAEGLYQCADGSMMAVVQSVARADDALVIRAREVAASCADEAAPVDAFAQLQAILEATADGILLLDHTGAVAGMNRRLARMWSLPDALLRRRDDAAVRDAMCAALKDDGLRLSGRFAQCAGNDDTFDLLTLKDGRVFECTSRPARHGGQVIGRVFCFSDASVRQRAANELAQARDAAEAASRAKSEFLAMMSHEIRTPMNAIIGMASLLESTGLDDEQQKCVGTIRSSGEALLAVIDDILDFARGDARKLALMARPFRIRELVDAVSGLFAGQARSSGVAFEVSVEHEVPDVLIGDEGRLRQVLINLLGNAFKFTPGGRVSVHVACAASHPGDRSGTQRLSIAVRDTGIGIDPRDQGAIFRPFMQADMSSTRPHGGAGLGLPICTMLCELMQGGIKVDSQPGQGTCFTVDVCLEQVPPAA